MQTEYGWVIIDTKWKNYMYDFTYSRTRTESIKKWVEQWDNPKTWKGHYYRGIRCVKAKQTIEVI